MAQLRDDKLLKKIAFVAKELREKKGLTLETVYNDTNIHVGRLESAASNLSISTLSVLCKYYKIKLSDFLKKVEMV